MNDDEYEYKWFWDVDGIYDLDGDLLVWSLMGVGIVSMQEAIFMSYGLMPSINRRINIKGSIE